MFRYVLVLPLGQTVSELLSQRSLARWRTMSCPGAAEWRSEETEGKQTDIRDGTVCLYNSSEEEAAPAAVFLE